MSGLVPLNIWMSVTCIIYGNLIHVVNIPFTVVSTSVKVTGLPTNLGSDEIEVYFETEKSGGRKGSIKKCVIEHNGVAFIEFDSPEGTCTLLQCHPPTSSHSRTLDSHSTCARLAHDSIECNNDSCALTQNKTAGTKTYTI